MRQYLAPMLLALAIASWPGVAGAVRFMDETTGPPVGTERDGFVEVLGPEATEPEHAGDFVGPLPEYMPTSPGSPCQCRAASAPNSVRPPLQRQPQ